VTSSPDCNSNLNSVNKSANKSIQLVHQLHYSYTTLTIFCKTRIIMITVTEYIDGHFNKFHRFFLQYDRQLLKELR